MLINKKKKEQNYEICESIKEKNIPDKQMFGLIFVIVLIILLFIQLWFMDVICRFRNFILERENSFALNLTSVLNENNEIFPNDLPPPFPYKGSIP